MSEVICLAAAISSLTGAVVAIFKVWQWGRRLQEGQKCLLRAQMLHTYYKHKEQETIRQYEFENFTACYQAYKAMGGNSFIEKVFEEVSDWEVET